MEVKFSNFKGIPFLNNYTDTKAILSASVGRRLGKAKAVGIKVISYDQLLNPDFIYMVFKKYYTSNPELDFKTPTKIESNKIKRALKELRSERPDWQLLFSVPVKFLTLGKKGLVSLTNIKIPQHIFLGSLAYRNHTFLKECIIHEYSHIWMNFLREINDYVHTDLSEEFVLPSGTRNKHAQGVILAAAFAGSVANYYIYTPKIKKSKDQIIYLLNYMKGCLEILKKYRYFTEFGKEVYKSLNTEYLILQKELKLKLR